MCAALCFCFLFVSNHCIHTVYAAIYNTVSHKVGCIIIIYYRLWDYFWHKYIAIVSMIVKLHYLTYGMGSLGCQH